MGKSTSFLSFLKEIYRIWITERPTQFAAALAYYAIFSFVPVIYIAFTLADILVEKLSLAEQFYVKAREYWKMGDVFMEVIHPWQIDAENLNVLERKAAKRIIAAAKPNQAFVDAFEKNLDKKLQTQGVKIIAEYKADDTYPIVGAASIVAKVHRDRAIKQLAKKHGPMGSGYPSDPDTRKFVEVWIREHKTIPDFVRKSWGTTRNIIEKAEQKPLTDF